MKQKQINYGVGAVVTEYRSLAVKLNENSKGVAVMNVRPCHILEICNRDALRNRTVLSLTHFTKLQLTYPKVIEANLDTVIQSFIKEGGDLKSAEIRIFGGDKQREPLRANLKDALKEKIPTCTIGEPKGHYTDKEGTEASVTDYLFRRDGVTFRSAKLSEDDGDKDIFSKDLLNANMSINREALNRYEAAMDEALKAFGFYFTQVRIRNAEVSNALNEVSRRDISIEEYNALPSEQQEKLSTSMETLVIKVNSVNPKEQAPALSI